ncbi:hypothetical protein [Streptomyces qinglanensis]|uniref:hypothetical protein n=1 Tax=Streptomyces qinglanensis TaxID=943816 RepID=UPI001112D9D8|nr:hypothetical protein [Streptomyces qinglanensis]
MERAGLAYYSDVNAVPTGPPSAGTVENEQRTWQKGGAMGELGPDGRERRPPVLPPVKVQDLKRRAEALKKLKKSIDGVITGLDTSSAAKHKIASKCVTRASLSGHNIPFFEADDLFSKCGDVFETLITLSQSLRDQIDAMRIAVKYADGGLDAVEEDERRRFWEIQARTEWLAEKAERHGEDHADKPGRKGGDVPADEQSRGNAKKSEH